MATKAGDERPTTVMSAAIRRAAILSTVAPYPIDSGKSVVMAGILRHLTSRLPAGGVHYLHIGEPLVEATGFGDVVLHELGRPTRADRLVSVVGALRPRGQSLQEAFLRSRHLSRAIQDTLADINADLELIDTIRMNQFVSGHSCRGRRVLYLDDLFSVRYQRMLQLTPAEARQSDFDPLGQFAQNVPRVLRPLTRMSWSRRVLLSSEARRVERSENRAARTASLSLLLNEDEAAALRASSSGRVMAIPPSIPRPTRPIRRWHGRPEFVFVGLLSLAHNHDGLSWFLRDGMEILLRECPTAVLHVIGRGAAPSLLARGGRFGDHVRFHGFVDDIDAIGENCALVNTLRFGSGVKIKTLDALARGLPVVATPFGAEGISSSSRPGLTIVNSAAEAGWALTRLTDQQVRASEGAAAVRFFADRFSPAVVADIYDEAFGTYTRI
jgi:glycosyltransferase involved in cell wall biosynthesis